MRSCLVTLLILVCVSLLSFVGCEKIINPPSMDAVERLFLDNYEDLKIVVEYLVNLENKEFNIDYAKKTPEVDNKETKIETPEVIEALNNLLSADKYKEISKSGNTIDFLQWNRLADCACGLVYSIDGSNNISIEYLTELIPLTEEGWYYYVADYNLWRIEHGA